MTVQSRPGEPRTLPLLAAAVAVALGLALVVLTGIAGFGRGDGSFAGDMRYLYVAGEMWERFQSPYITEPFKAAMLSAADIASINYAYPPNSAPLALALSSGSLAGADVLITVLNVAALGCMIWYVVRADALARGDGSPASVAIRDPLVLLAIAVVIGNPFASHVFWMGQTTLIAAALLLLAWLAAHRGHDLAAGMLLALGAFKPQLAILIALWFLLDRRWLLLFTAAGVTLLMSAWPIAATGVGGSWLAWLSSLSDYQGAVYNVIEFKHVFGVRSLAATLGWSLPSLLLPALAALVWLYLQRHRYASIWLAGPLFAISTLLVYAHDYDLAAMSVMTLPLLIASRANPAVLTTIAMCAALIFMPQRIWEHFGLAELARSREVAMIGLVAIYLTMCRHRQPVPAARPVAVAG